MIKLTYANCPHGQCLQPAMCPSAGRCLSPDPGGQTGIVQGDVRGYKAEIAALQKTVLDQQTKLAAQARTLDMLYSTNAAWYAFHKTGVMSHAVLSQIAFIEKRGGDKLAAELKGIKLLNDLLRHTE